MGPSQAIGRFAASVLLVALSLIACGDDDVGGGNSAAAWGSLAVVPGPPSGNEALISGTLLVTEDCVTIRSGSDAEESLLVWPAETTSWNSDTRTIVYSDGRETVELSDGDEVAFGGGGSSTDEDGLEPAEWVDSIDWISQPDASCPMEVRWFVGGLTGPTSTAP